MVENDNLATTDKFYTPPLKPEYWARQKLIIILISLPLPPLGLVVAAAYLTRHKPAFKLAVGFAALVVAVSALGTGAYYYLYHQYFRVQSYRVTYSGFDNYKVPGPAAGSGISFQKPVEFTQIDPKGEENIANFSQQSSANPVIYSGGLSATSVAAVEGYSNTLKAIFLRPSTKTYQSTIKTLNDYTTGEVSYLFFPGLQNNATVNLSKPSVLVTTNLKTAWRFNYSATNNHPKRGAPSKISGELVFAAGQRADYYFLVGALDYNWQANNTVWPKLINSLKIDQ